MATSLNSDQVRTSASASLSDYSDPLFVAYNELMTASLVNHILIDETNFVSWRKYAELSLGCKNKLEFINGEIPKPTDPAGIANWNRCNHFVFRWLLNSVSDEIGSALIHSANTAIEAWAEVISKFSIINEPRIYHIQSQIYNLSQGDLTVSSYHDQLTKLWGEEDSISFRDCCDLGTACKSTIATQKKRNMDKLMKFLMGLNDDYTQIRSQILAMKPMPNISQAYSLVIRDESLRYGKKLPLLDGSAMLVSQESSAQNKNNKKRPECSYCQRLGHTRDKCYKLHGYPTDKDGKKKPPKFANNIISETQITDDESKQSSFNFNKDQMNKLMAFLSNNDTDHSAAGIICSTSMLNKYQWILDSGASDHISPYIDILYDLENLSTPIQITLPNGQHISVTQIGKCNIGHSITLTNVLLIPSIKYNLLSISKLLNDRNCLIQFSNHGCSIQDLVKETSLLIGESKGIYYFEADIKNSCFSISRNKDSMKIWHQRLGHIPIPKLVQHVSQDLPGPIRPNKEFLCDVCPWQDNVENLFRLVTQ